MLLGFELQAALRTTLQRLEQRGEVLANDRLHAYYARFRERFGPEALASVDGPALLDRMHGRGEARDSLTYWLEFKNDDEFPGDRFGGIGGGSSLKFEIYRSRKGEWMRGRGTKQAPIGEDEAVQVARRQRAELIAGVRLLDGLAARPEQVDYAALEAEMARVAPTTANTMWGHKYFALMAPTLLDDYHVESFQRFYLLKLLQLPPESGRYRMAETFQAGARELGVPIAIFTTLLNAHFGGPYRCWRIGTTDGQDGEDLWPAMRDGQFVAIGWDEIASVGEGPAGPELREHVARALAEGYPDQEQGWRSKAETQIVRFVEAIRPGDLVLAARGQTVLGIGEVTGDYYYTPDQLFAHRRPVRWRSLQSWQFPELEKPRIAVVQIERPANLLAAEQTLARGEPAPKPHNPITRPSPPALTGVLRQVEEALTHKPQVILSGPPGTGKTFWAHRAAGELAARSWFQSEFAALTPEQRTELEGPDGALEACTFHPGFGYEDFLEGLRPLLHAGQLAFERRPGVFMRLCERARRQPSRRFFLLIDEINRGDIPRIFGELLTLLERDKRGRELSLPLSGERFAVPANVEIVATMNTADRSISLLDAALRRRFAFIELMPDAQALGDAVVLDLPLGPLLTWINDRLRGLGPELRHLQVGHAYLMHDHQPLTDPLRFAAALRHDLLPLLEEYCYEDRQQLPRLLGPGLFRAGSTELDPTLFTAPRLAELSAALRSHFAEQLRHPEIVALLERAAAANADPAAEDDE